MRTLSLLGLGLLLVLLDLSINGVDLVADWAGWLVALLACAGLPPGLRPARLTATGTVALAVSVVTWVPGVLDTAALPLPLAWALSVPEILFGLMLALAVAAAAGVAGDDSARGWWRLVAAGHVVMLLLPPVVYGAGIVTVLVVGVVVGLAAAITEIVLCFRHSGRPWAQGPAAPVPQP